MIPVGDVFTWRPKPEEDYRERARAYVRKRTRRIILDARYGRLPCSSCGSSWRRSAKQRVR